MKELKWFLFGIFTAGLGLLIYKIIKGDFGKNVRIKGFADGFMGGFGAAKSPTAHKEYGEIAKHIQQKQARFYAKIDTEYKKSLAQ